jgi:hypothetical protein
MRGIIFIMLCILITPLAYAQDYRIDDTFPILGEWTIVYGNWVVRENTLVMDNPKQTITHISRIVKQEGVMEYEFTCSYIRGLEDKYGGFGIHICINKPTSSRSWGMNRSYLFWITYDPAAYTRDDCFFLQVYKSRSPISMNFLHNEPGDTYPLDPGILSPAAFMATGETGAPLTFRFQVDTATGKGEFYHPSQEGIYFPFDVKTAIEPGMYISLRTNSMSIKVIAVRVRQVE